MLPYVDPPVDPKLSAKMEKLLTDSGALRRHDGHPRRPYLLINSIKDVISNIGVNFELLHPRSQHDIANRLANHIKSSLQEGCTIMGRSGGDEWLAHDMAEMFPRPFCLVKKWNHGYIISPLYREKVYRTTYMIPVTWCLRHGDNFESMRASLREAGYTNIAPFDVAAIELKCQHYKRMRRTLSLATISSTSWEYGDNPFTEDRNERVAPVRLNTRGWKRFTYKYK